MKKIKFLIYLLAFAPIFSCQDYLDESPKGKIIPKTVDDLGGMMDDFYGNLGNSVSSGVSYSILLDDDAQIYTADQEKASDQDKKIHTWSSEIFTAAESDKGWDGIYHSLYTCNWVLTNINSAEEGISYDMKEVEAWAYVQRAFNYLQAVNTYAPFYNASTAETDLGVPMPLEADINAKLSKSTVAVIYAQILSDINMAIPNLKDTEKYPFRPSKLNAYALLARTYMFMQNYDEMLIATREALKIKSTLIDYNTLSPTWLNDMEVTGWDSKLGQNFLSPDILLYKTSEFKYYQLSEGLLSCFNKEQDLRYRYFTSNLNINTFQTGTDIRSTFLYDCSLSLTMGELYMMAAEAEVRSDNGSTVEALNILNTLRKNRMENIEDLVISDKTILLETILKERRIETRMKGLRWFDLKRLNITTPIEHKILDKTYTYSPAEGEYYMPIPTNVLQANPALK